MPQVIGTTTEDTASKFTSFTGTVTATSQIFTFDSEQNGMRFTNKGDSIVTLTVNNTLYKVPPKATIEIDDESFSSFDAKTASGSQTFEIKSFVRKSGSGSGVDSYARSEISSLSEQLAEKAAQLNSHHINVKYPPPPLISAKADDLTDDTSAIHGSQEYLLNTYGGGIVFLPAGTYKHMGLVIKSGITLIGVGASTVLKLYAEEFHIKVNTSGDKDVNLLNFQVDNNQMGHRDAGAIQINYAENFLIENVIVHNTPDGVNGISTSQVGTKGTIRGCHIYDCGKGGIYASTNTAFLVIENNIVHDIFNSGFDVPGIQVIGGHNTRIVNNLVYNCPQAGIYAYTGDNYPTLDDVSWGILIEGNVCYGNKRGIHIVNPSNLSADLVALNFRSIISKNHCYENTETGIKLELANNVIVTDNMCYDNTNGTAGSGMLIKNSKNLVIEGNQCFDNYYAGMVMDGVAESSIVSNRTYQYNKTQQRGLLFQSGGSNNLLFQGNSFKGSVTNISGISLLTTSKALNNSPEFYERAFSWNPTSIATGAGETSSDVTVTGAELGDSVVVFAPYDLQGLVAFGYVSASGVVKVRLHNGTGASVDLGTGNWKVRVIKQ